MTTSAHLAEFAALLGNPTRAGMLLVLMDGRALTATELARAAHVAPQTASEHLEKMVSAGVLKVERQGRHRFHSLASASIAQLIEHIVQATPQSSPMLRPPFTGPRDTAMRMARTCYDHLAGRLGVAITDALINRRYIELGDDGGLLTASGMELLRRLGMDTLQPHGARSRKGPVFCRLCLDWSERRPHVAGALGSALCSFSFQQDWIRRSKGSRAVIITRHGYRSYEEHFGVRLEVSGAYVSLIAAPQTAQSEVSS